MLSIALAGLGTVGAGVARCLRQNADVIAAQAGTPITLTAVSARHKNKNREVDLAGVVWVDDARALATRPDVDVVVEVMGGADGIARDVAEAALKNGKHLVTANKALLAKHGAVLGKGAEEAGCTIGFEAAVGGGLPVIKTLREALAANTLSSVRGILNGTCNYILTRMGKQDCAFGDALAEAQRLGYAEADPSSDIDGHDTAHKLSLLSALAFGGAPMLAAVKREGIRHITPLDLQFAAELNCRLKLLGVARRTETGIAQHVGPALVSCDSALAYVDGVLNAVYVQGDFIGDLMLSGQGAGATPTASAVVADLIDLARGRGAKTPLFQSRAVPVAREFPLSRYYMRLNVLDKSGVVADISAILRDEAISIESLLQHGRSKTGSVPVVITTHDAKDESIRAAAAKIAQVGTVVEPPCIMPIED